MAYQRANACGAPYGRSRRHAERRQHPKRQEALHAAWSGGGGQPFNDAVGRSAAHAADDAGRRAAHQRAYERRLDLDGRALPDAHR